MNPYPRNIDVCHEESHFQLLTPNGHHRPTIPPILYPLPPTSQSSTKLHQAVQNSSKHHNTSLRKPIAPTPPYHLLPTYPLRFAKLAVKNTAPTITLPTAPPHSKLPSLKRVVVVNAVGVPKHAPLFEASGTNRG